MVSIRIFSLLVCFFLVSAKGLAGFDEPSINLPAKVSVKIDQANENSSIMGTVSIIRLDKQKVDETSFTLDDKALKVVLVGDDWPQGKGDADSLVVSTYSFTLPPKEKGLYFLKPIRVSVGGMAVSSNSISYEVTASSVDSSKFALQARLVNKPPIFPGQKVTFEYRIIYQSPIQLTKEELPLLNFPGFRSIGAPQISNEVSGGSSVQVITQQAIAESMGTFHSGPSIIEGYVYAQNAQGVQVYTSPLLRAEAAELVVQVSSFPSDGRPVSFNGAVGVFRWQIELVGSSSVLLGEKIKLQIFVSGQGDLETLQPPDLRQQAGFKDRFLMSDIPPVGEIRNGTKTFILELRPIQKDIRQIPSIETSSFDPTSGTYVVTRSSPISISVRQTASSSNSAKKQPEKAPAPAVGPIEIQGNVMLEESQLRTHHLDAILLVYTAVFLIIAFGIQCLLLHLMAESKEKVFLSHDLFLKAIKNKASADESARLIRQALLLALFEAGHTKVLVTHPEELSDEGLQGEIKALLSSIEQKRFTGLETQVEINEIIAEATQLYTRVKK